MKLTVKETLEQGRPRSEGGMLKLTAGTYEVKSDKDGLTLSSGTKLSNERVENLIKLGLVTVD
jgi:hypothetical protein